MKYTDKNFKLIISFLVILIIFLLIEIFFNKLLGGYLSFRSILISLFAIVLSVLIESIILKDTKDDKD